MTSRTRRAAPGPRDPEAEAFGGALGELLDVERRIEADVAAARTEAARVVESARSAADALAAEEDGTFEASLAELRRSIDAETDAAIVSLERDAVAGAEVFLRVDGPTLELLARNLAARILGEDVQ